MSRSTFEKTPIEILLPVETLVDDAPYTRRKPAPKPPRKFWAAFLIVLLRALSACHT